MIQKITFGQWLKSRRRILDLTQQALADRVNCSVQTIYKIEAGQRRPSAQVARLLGEELNIPTNEWDDFIQFARSMEPTKLHASHVEATPWRDAFIPKNNLPLQLTALIGREEHLEDAVRRLRQDDVRLFTIVGPPGIGKTRLAIQLGNDVLSDFPDGVYFVELGSVTHPDTAILAIARTLEISIAGHKRPLDSLKAYLYERRLLLILDNFEQILEAAPFVYEILVACPLVNVVVTSRAPLRVRGERLFPIEPLALPARVDDLSVQRLAGYAAVQLFMERAKAVQPDFELTTNNSPVVAAICARLDGLPLAIEIVAAQMTILHPEEILDRLTGRRLLESQGMADSDPRHQTLNAAIRWSYRLLDTAEQMFFRRIGVFADGCTLEAAQFVCQPKQDSMHVLAQLVGMNLLKRDTVTGGTSRYLMLETIREFARHELHTRGEWPEIEQRHAAYFHDFALALEKSVRGEGQISGLERIEREHSNLQLALDHFLTTQAWEQGLRLAGALIEFWVYHNQLIIGLRYARELLDATATVANLHEGRARVLNGVAMMSYFAGDYAAIGPSAEAALATAKAANSDRDIAWACIALGMRSGGMGNFEEAIRYFEQGMDATRQTEVPSETAGLLNGLGEVARSQGHYEEAMAYYQQALPIAREMGSLWLSAHILDNIGHAAYSRGHYDMARDYIRQSMEASVALGDERGIAMCLEKIGGISIAQEQFEVAARLLGAAETLRKAKNTPVEGMDAADYEQFVVTLQEQLPTDVLNAAWQEGQQLPLSQLIDQILIE